MLGNKDYATDEENQGKDTGDLDEPVYEGAERRKERDRRSGKDRRIEDESFDEEKDRRSGKERRSGKDRRKPA